MANTSTNGVGTDWQVAGNWTAGVPTGGADVISIGHNMTNVPSITMTTGSITHTNGKTLAYVNNAVTWSLNGAGVITLGTGTTPPPNLAGTAGTWTLNSACDGVNSGIAVAAAGSTFNFAMVTTVLGTLTISGGTINANSVSLTIGTLIVSGVASFAFVSTFGTPTFIFSGTFPKSLGGTRTIAAGLYSMIIRFNGTFDTTGWTITYNGSPSSIMNCNQDGILGSNMIAPVGGLNIAASKQVTIAAGVSLTQYETSTDCPITLGANSLLVNNGSIVGGTGLHRWVLNGVASSGLFNYGTLNLVTATIGFPIYTVNTPTLALWGGFPSSFGANGKFVPLRREAVVMNVDVSQAYGFTNRGVLV